MKNLVIIFFIFTASLFSQEKKNQHPIDKWFDDCMAIGENQSTRGMLDCTDKAIEKWDKELNKVYKELMKNLKPEDQKVLKETQREWIKYRDEEYKLLDKIYSYKEGTMYLPMHAYGKLDIIRSRTMRLQDYLDLLNEK